MFQNPFFDSALKHLLEVHQKHYGARLVSIYVTGSVHRWEATPGFSDLDTWVFIADEYTAEDRQWEVKAEHQLVDEVPGFHHVSRAIMASKSVDAACQELATIQAVRRQEIWRHNLRYDATLFWGEDLNTGRRTKLPDAKLAHWLFPNVYKLVRFSVGLEPNNESDFRLPDPPCRRLRKLARLSVLSGAYLMMARSQFISYRGADVLPSLLSASDTLSEHHDFLALTESRYYHPVVGTEADVLYYLSRFVPWLEWVNNQIDDSIKVSQ